MPNPNDGPALGTLSIGPDGLPVGVTPPPLRVRLAPPAYEPPPPARKAPPPPDLMTGRDRLALAAPADEAEERLARMKARAALERRALEGWEPAYPHDTELWRRGLAVLLAGLGVVGLAVLLAYHLPAV